MVLAKVGDQYINLEAIASASLVKRSGEERLETYAVIEMIGGGATTIFEEDAIAFIAFLEKKTQYSINVPSN